MSSRPHHHGSLLGYLDAYLHGPSPVGALATLPLIQCLRPWWCCGEQRWGRREKAASVWSTGQTWPP
jgi:hypothetical protein